MKIFLLYLLDSKEKKLSPMLLKHIFMRGVNEECIDVLFFVKRGEISKFSFNGIYTIYRNYSNYTIKKTCSHKYIPSTKIIA